QMLRQALGEIERALAADIVLEHAAELGREGRIAPRLLIRVLQRHDVGHQRLGGEAAAIGAEMALGVGTGAIAVRLTRAAATDGAWRAAVTKAAIWAMSLTPGALSTPDAVSTPGDSLSAMARAALS